MKNYDRDNRDRGSNNKKFQQQPDTNRPGDIVLAVRDDVFEFFQSECRYFITNSDDTAFKLITNDQLEELREKIADRTGMPTQIITWNHRIFPFQKRDQTRRQRMSIAGMVIVNGEPTIAYDVVFSPAIVATVNVHVFGPEGTEHVKSHLFWNSMRDE